MTEKRRKTARMWLRVDENTKVRIQEYATRHDTDVSGLVSAFFERLLAREDEELAREAEAKFF